MIDQSKRGLVEALESRRLLASFLVTTVADAGPGSLRDAITQANATPAPDTVSFALGGIAPHTIVLNSPLPTITQPLTTDGTTQLGFAGAPIVRVDGSALLPALSVGLSIYAPGVTVRGLAFTSFQTGLRTSGNATQVVGNYFGMLSNGMTRTPMGRGVVVTGGANTVIGGAVAGDRNVFAFGSYSDPGIGVQVSQAEGVAVLGNYFGTTANGMMPNGSIGVGVVFDGDSTGEIGRSNATGNVIAGIQGPGVVLDWAGVVMAGNRIGLNAFNMPLGNSSHGVLVTDGHHVIDAGLNYDAPNIIAHNGGDGVCVPGPEGVVSITQNSIFGNGELGIDLGDNGINVNDLGDFDTGPNGLQNYPVISDAWKLPNGKVRFRGNLNSLANEDYYIDFYAQMTHSPTFYGEGETFIGTEIIHVKPNGAGEWDFISNGNYPVGLFLTTTAERTSNTGTSEFSRSFRVYLPGDANGDGVVNNQDIYAFVLALTHPFDYGVEFPDQPIISCDLNDDGVVNNQDIAPFVDLLTSLRPVATPDATRIAKAPVLSRTFAERALELRSEPEVLATLA